MPKTPEELYKEELKQILIDRRSDFVGVLAFLNAREGDEFVECLAKLYADYLFLREENKELKAQLEGKA